MKKLAIVSSYNELCGNATYTEVLRKEFSKFYQTDVLALKVKLLSRSHSAVRKKAEKHIADMAASLKQYDYVNIQFEAGLFGTHPRQIFRRFKALLDASPNAVVTLHRLDLKQSLFDKDYLRALVAGEFKIFLKSFKDCLRNNYFARLYAKVVALCKERDIPIIVHTKRDKDLLELIFDAKNVYDHPISFLSKEEIAHYKATTSREALNEKYGLEKEDILIGIFGFVSKYKGHDVVIQALRYLPKNYKLLICGSQHPYGIVPNRAIDPYIKELLFTIDPSCASLKEKNANLIPNSVTSLPSLADRVIFCGAPDDNDYIRMMLTCDIHVLPYIETNQSGSGNASLALECGANVIFSLTHSTLELSRYAPDCFQTFGIGNYIELANTIQYLPQKPVTQLTDYMNRYNIHTNIELYRKAFGDCHNKVAENTSTQHATPPIVEAISG